MAITRLGPNQDITAAKIAGTINFKNLIINGDMSIAQRGAGPSGSFAGTGYSEGPDRMNHVVVNIGNWQTQQESISSGNAYNTGFVKAFRIDCTSADSSPAAGDIIYVRQKIEAQNLQMINKGKSTAEKLTLSFWVKSNKTGTYTVRLYDHDNTRFVVQNYSISSASTWEQKIINFPADTTGTLNNDNGIGLDLAWYLGGGSDYTGGTQQTTWGAYANANALPSNHVNLADSTDNDWSVTGVQLEADTSASDFEFLPYDVNLRRCLRYFWSSAYTAGANSLSAPTNKMLEMAGSVHRVADSNASAKWGDISNPVPLRTNGSVTFFNPENSGTSGQARVFYQDGNAGNITPSGTNYTTHTMVEEYTGISGSLGDSVVLGFHIQVSAEL
jgi:hypothetical protein